MKGSRRRPCKIRDYCPGGLHVDVPRPAWDGRGAKAPPLAQRGDAAVVQFAADGQEFEVRLQVARVFDGGLGVAFVEENPTAVRALHQVAVGVQEQGGKATPATIEAIRSACRVALAELVEPGVTKMMRDIGGPLVQAASAVGNNAGQSRYFDAISALDASRGAIAAEVLGTIRRHIAEFGDAAAKPRQPPTDDQLDGEFADELSLVNVEEFEDFLVVAELVSAADLGSEAPLKELERRLRHALGTQPENDENPVNPVCAAVVCNAFREAIAGFPLHRDARLLLYRELERQVVPLFGSMYQDINAELERIGVRLPPRQRKKVPRPHNPTAAETASADEIRETTADPDAAAESGGPAAGAEAAVATGAAPDTVPMAQEGAATLRGTGPQVVSIGVTGSEAASPASAGGGVLAQAPTAAATGAFAGVASAGEQARPGGPRQTAFGTARTLLGLQRRLAAPPVAQSADDEAPPAALPAYSGDQIVSALDALLRDGFGRAGDEGSGGGLLAALDARLAGGSAAGDERALATSEADPVALMDRLFSAIRKDPLLCEETIARIDALQPAVHKANLIEPGFFDDETHPARRVLDALGRLDAAIGDNHAVSDESVPAIVDTVLAPMLEARAYDLEPLHEAADSLDDLAGDLQETYERNVAAVVAAREAQEAFLRSRRTGDADKGRADTSHKTQSLEWNVWLNRVRRLRVGDTLLVSDPGAPPRRLCVAWISTDHEMLLLVDSLGAKADSPILQELAMRMRRGTATLQARTRQPLVVRALAAALADMHGGIEHRASHDPVTGLTRFKHFESEVGQALTRAVQDHLEHVLLHVSLDNFNSVREQAGAAAADSLMRAATETLVAAQRKGSLVASLGEGALGVLLEECPAKDGASAAERLCEALAETRVEVETTSIAATASIGLAVINKHSADVVSVFAAARAAAEEARAAGKGRTRTAPVADDEETRSTGPMMEWVPLLNRTLRGGQPHFRWQRIAPLQADAEAAPFCELLLDLVDDKGEPVPPGKLLTAAVYYHHMLELDRWIIRNALACMAVDAERLADIGACAINLADDSLADERLVAYLVDELLTSGVPPGKVCFEISEAATLANIALVEDLVFTLREYGCRFTLVGVGAGRSSYQHLEQLPVDFIKIGGIFLRDIATSSEDLAVVQSIHEIGHFLGKQTIAECVEDDETLRLLREMGVDYAQGYAIDRPHKLDEGTVLADGDKLPPGRMRSGA